MEMPLMSVTSKTSCKCILQLMMVCKQGACSRSTRCAARSQVNYKQTQRLSPRTQAMQAVSLFNVAPCMLLALKVVCTTRGSSSHDHSQLV